ncbi:hypothetical protein [Microbacterium sp. STF-2]|uniref:hypothetical protein n=1 Tax=unclassified Microbacterium TaxID=2609290 RepID=UPI002AFE0733|nr:hypothetical protein [Microbacterium sp. STF-2]MEA1263279.1 hypothetical protein [Microbacterium sp. STF-2]
MTKMHRSALENTTGQQPWKASLWFEPAMFGLIAAGVFALAPPPNLPGDYGDQYAAIGTYLTPVLDQSLAALGVVGTIIVSIAVMTRFGLDAETLHPKLHQILTTVLFVTFLLLLFMAACSVRIAAGDSTRWPETVVVLVLTWILSLAARLAIGRTSPQTAADQETERWRRQRRRAQSYGIRRTDDPPAHPYRGAILVLVAPSVLWLVVIAFVAVLTAESTDAWREFALPLYWTLPTITIATISIMWWLTRDMSIAANTTLLLASPLVAIALTCGGLLTLIVFLAHESTAPWFGVGVGAIVLVLAQVTFLTLTPIRRRVPWIRDAEDSATIRSLRRSRKNAKRLRERATAASAAHMTSI